MTAATSMGSAVRALRSVDLRLVSLETAPVHRLQLRFPCRGKLVLHPMVAAEAQTSTLAMWYMETVATSIANVESCQSIAVLDGKSSSKIRYWPQIFLGD